MELESGTGGDRDVRPPILDNSTAVVYLTPDADPISLDFKVPAPGEYMFVVHYYQPDHPGEYQIGIYTFVKRTCESNSPVY